MTQEEKDLLLKDLCARLPYGVKVSILEYLNAEILVGLDINKQTFNLEYSIGQPIFSRHNDLIIKPYLRPMSSMTEEENKQRKELNILLWSNSNGERGFDGFGNISGEDVFKAIDWLNAHHFDYYGLIPKGLALAAPEEMYKN